VAILGVEATSSIIGIDSPTMTALQTAYEEAFMPGLAYFIGLLGVIADELHSEVFYPIMNYFHLGGIYLLMLSGIEFFLRMVYFFTGNLELVFLFSQAIIVLKTLEERSLGSYVTKFISLEYSFIMGLAMILYSMFNLFIDIIYRSYMFLSSTIESVKGLVGIVKPGGT